MVRELNFENLALYALLRDETVKWAGLRNELAHVGSAAEILRARLGTQLLDDDFDEAIRNAEAEIRSFERDGIFVDTVLGREYPEQLRTIHDYPPVIYWMGHQDPDDYLAVAIVGSREPSEGALNFARELGLRLGKARIPVVSGLAHGIDVTAMRASLEAGNRTIGVIGTGVRHSYPAANREVQKEIASRHLLISQFRPDTSGSPRHFPMRNVVMSGFASLTVIAEASEKSGTRTQANAAVRHGRPLIISRAVHVRTTWGKRLVDDGYDVQVVGDAAEAESAIQRIHQRYSSLANWPAHPLLVR